MFVIFRKIFFNVLLGILYYTKQEVKESFSEKNPQSSSINKFAGNSLYYTLSLMIVLQQVQSAILEFLQQDFNGRSLGLWILANKV